MLFVRISVIIFVCSFYIAMVNAQKLINYKSMVKDVASNNPLKEKPHYCIKFNKKINVKLIVSTFSRDSIEIQITFVNNSSESLFLYKPLLPLDGRLNYPTFNFQIEDKNKKEDILIPFIDSIASMAYNPNQNGDYGILTPELLEDKFLLLPVNGSINFKLNVAKFYNFKLNDLKGVRDFSVGYVVFMPLINSKFEQVKETVKGDGKDKKPVYLCITTADAPKDDKYLVLRSRFTIE